LPDNAEVKAKLENIGAFVYASDFETGLNGLNTRDFSPASVNITDTGYNSGHSLNVDGRQLNWHGAALNREILKNGETYYLSAWVKHDADGAQTIGCKFQYVGADGEPHFDDFVVNNVPSGEWVHIIGSATLTADHTGGLTIFFELGDQADNNNPENFIPGQFWIDDVVITAIGPGADGAAKSDSNDNSTNNNTPDNFEIPDNILAFMNNLYAAIQSGDKNLVYTLTTDEAVIACFNQLEDLTFQDREATGAFKRYYYQPKNGDFLSNYWSSESGNTVNGFYEGEVFEKRHNIYEGAENSIDTWRLFYKNGIVHPQGSAAEDGRIPYATFVSGTYGTPDTVLPETRPADNMEWQLHRPYEGILLG
jgi:hypothetical protein